MGQKNMEYCMFCGTKLKDRELDGEGIIPYCEKCGEYRFPVFSTAVSMIVTNTDREKFLLGYLDGEYHFE